MPIGAGLEVRVRFLFFFYRFNGGGNGSYFGGEKGNDRIEMAIFSDHSFGGLSVTPPHKIC